MAGNITGQVFDEKVTKQIETRQKFLGKRYKDDQTLIYTNNQSSFLRLSSSINIGDEVTSVFTTNLKEKGATSKQLNLNKLAVDKALQGAKVETIGKDTDGDGLDETTVLEITESKIQEGINQLKQRGIDENMTGMELAKACVLFGGTVGVDNNLNPQLKFGIYDTTNPDPVTSIAAYGWGGLGKKGYVPMPAIDNAKVSFYNRGAIQKADVKIKVYSLEQLQIFDLLYFRIGYSMLLEWGHNVWIDNKDQKLKNRNEFVTKPFEKFFEEGTTQQNILKSIRTQRESDSYNYDAMLGKVTNFTWKFNDDGTYDINLKLIGAGDIIESLKVNKAALITNSSKDEKTPSQQNADVDKNLNARDKAIDNKNEEIASNLAKEQEKLQKKVDNVNKELKKLSDEYRTKMKSQPIYSWVDYGAEQAVKNLQSFGGSLSIQASSDPETNQGGYDQINDARDQINEMGNTFIDDEGYSDYAEYKFQRYHTPYKVWADALRRILKKMEIQLNKISPSDTAAVASAEKAKEDQEKESERQKQALNAERQKLEKRKEQLSLSPETSLESKNKSLLNQQLVKWRSKAQRGQEKNDLQKLSFTANSASPDSTGTKTIKLDFYYVRMGRLLNWINDNLLIYDDTKTDEDNNESPNPIFKIDTNPNTNFCLRFPGQFSSDPKVCIIPSKYNNQVLKVSWSILNNLNRAASFFVDGNDQIGKLMNIFVNIDHTASVLDKNMDSNGKVNLNKFLTSLLSDINDCLGNVNKLEPVFDAEGPTLTIIDANNVPNADKEIKDPKKENQKMAVFQSYGIGTKDNPLGSFLNDVNFQVQLPPNMAAMATISAQANGNIVGENATGLSKLNTGLTDRIVSTKLDADSIEGAKTGKDDPTEIFKKIIKEVNISINDLYVKKKYANDTVSSMRSNNRDIALYLTGNEEYLKTAPSPFFIPFNLKLDMQGLSGMKNYERFSITEAILPYSYRSGDQGGVINFLIKGVSHKIDNNKWTTDIESLSVGALPSK